MGTGPGVLVEEPFHPLAANDVGGDYLFHVVGTDAGVERVVGNDLYDRAFLAETEATGDKDFHLAVYPVLGERSAEVLHDLCALGSLATGTAAAENLHMRGAFVEAAGEVRGGLVALLPYGECRRGFPSDAFKGIG